MCEVRYCFVGDSLTAGTGDESYRGWLADLFAACTPPYRTFYNLGVRSNTSEDIKARFEAECAARLPPPFDGRVAFGFGTNDSAILNGGGLRVPLASSIANARHIFQAVARHGWLPIWFGPMPLAAAHVTYVAHSGMRYDFHEDRIAAFDRSYRQTAKELGIPYVSFYEKLCRSDAFRTSLREGDGLHPSASGYRLVAEMPRRDGVMQRWMEQPNE